MKMEMKMNIVDHLIARIEDYRATNKNPCKSYATREAAEKAIAGYAAQAGLHFDMEGNPARYIVFFNEAWGRWVGALDYTELLRRRTAMGGYLGVIKGVFTY